MHKFFCTFNNLTQRYELSYSRNSFSGILSAKAPSQTETTLLGEIKSILQELYFNVVLFKETENTEVRLNILDETELLISNLYYSLFASPLELPQQEKTTTENKLSKALELVGKLEKIINIPEYNRLVTIIRNNISSLL